MAIAFPSDIIKNKFSPPFVTSGKIFEHDEAEGNEEPVHHTAENFLFCFTNSARFHSFLPLLFRVSDNEMKNKSYYWLDVLFIYFFYRYIFFFTSSLIRCFEMPFSMSVFRVHFHCASG